MRPVVVALNPSIDAEWRVDGVRWEEKNNVLAERRWAGGKGINVARWLKHLGEHPQLILPLGGASGRELAACLREERISTRIISIRETTRVNIIVTAEDQGQLRFNPLGPRLAAAEWCGVLNAIVAALRNASCLVLSGSLPRGVPINAYAQIIRLARNVSVPVLLDCDGPALAAAVRAKPFLVKPNEHELMQWARNGDAPPAREQPSRSPGSTDRVRRAGRRLSEHTRGWVFVSRGAGPALLANAGEGVELTAEPPRVKPRNTVGAGDALLAAVAQQVIRRTPPQDWLRAGLATGSAATQLPAGELPPRR